MRLNSLLASVLPNYQPHQADGEVLGITADSRKVEPGYLFVALDGVKNQGNQYIKEAQARGAIAIVTNLPVSLSIPVITVKDPRSLLSQLAAKFYSPQPPLIVAVTGTNGKTSTVDFTRQLWTALGLQAASIGTLGIISPTYQKTGSHTTPPAEDLHYHLMQLAQQKIQAVALEASSHGLDQLRLDHVELAAAGFTNLTIDHLDYHQSMENYRQAKFRLFTQLLAPGRVAVINADTPEYTSLQEICKQRQLKLIDYGRQAQYLKIIDITPTAAGQWVTLDILNHQRTNQDSTKGGKQKFLTSIAGEFQIYNILCAVGLVLAKYPHLHKILQCIPLLKPVHGRLEAVGKNPYDAPVFVDYAHTPDALKRVLETLRPITKKRLLVVFGCGGDRDKTKRPLMGKIAHDLADKVIVTDDNPRTENALEIRKQILAACPHALEIPDRAQAIQQAIQQLQSGDVLLIAGKGHETGQIIGKEILPFDDCDIARKYLTLMKL